MIEMTEFRKKTLKELICVVAILLVTIFLGRPILVFLARYVIYWALILILAFIIYALGYSFIKGRTWDEWID